MSRIIVGVRGVDDATYRAFKALAIARGLRLGEALTIAMRRFLKKQAISDRSPSALHHLDEVEPFSFGPGSEHLSELIS